VLLQNIDKDYLPSDRLRNLKSKVRKKANKSNCNINVDKFEPSIKNEKIIPITQPIAKGNFSQISKRYFILNLSFKNNDRYLSLHRIYREIESDLLAKDKRNKYHSAKAA